MLIRLLILAIVVFNCGPAYADVAAGSVFTAQDTLSVELDDPEHRALLEPLTWLPGSFDVHLERAENTGIGADWIVSFTSPLSDRRPPQDEARTVYLDWFMARDADGTPLAAPAVVIVPGTDRRRLAARALAIFLKARAVHVLVLQPPGYGRRGDGGLSRPAERFLPRVRQAVADARRARDAAAALPGVRDQPVYLAGISLGGFLAVLTAELDPGYDGLFVLLAGVDLHHVVTHGDRDAARFRRRLEAAGFQGQALRDLLWQVEPLRAADRLDPTRTWLYRGMYDTVIPPASTEKLADAIRLPPEHHHRYPVGHYDGAFLLPAIAADMASTVTEHETD